MKNPRLALLSSIDLDEANSLHPYLDTLTDAQQTATLLANYL